jgi:hypothetical protein
MSRPLPAALVWLLLAVVHVALVWHHGTTLPARVATHFNLQGLANGWQTRGDFLLWASLGPIAMGLFVVVVIGLCLKFPRAWNLPHKAYWTAPEQLPQARAFLLAWAFWLAALLLLSTGLLLQGVLQVNLGAVPVRLPRLWTVLAIVLPTPLIGLMIGWLYVFFGRPAGGDFRSQISDFRS